MGLKSGSRDAGLDDDDPDEPADSEPPRQADSGADTTEPSTDATESNADAADGTSDPRSSEDATPDGTSDHPDIQSLPYVLRRDQVNDGRDQVPFFLRETVINGERELQETLEATLGEHVYKSDYREAAMVVAQEHPELVAEVLRRWGYDL